MATIMRKKEKRNLTARLSHAVRFLPPIKTSLHDGQIIRA